MSRFTIALIIAFLLVGALALPCLPPQHSLTAAAETTGSDTEIVDRVKTGENVAPFEQYRITGIVIDKISHVAYSGFTIRAFPSSAPQTLLGVGLTDAQGRYDIRFESQPANISIEVFNRREQKVRSVVGLAPNARGVTQVDFFLFRKEAVPDDFCCSSNNSLGACPPPDRTKNRLIELISRLKLLAPRFRRLRAEAYKALTRPTDPTEDCGERQKTKLIEVLESRGELKLLKEVKKSCISSSFPSKTWSTDYFEIQYVEQQGHPWAVRAARPTVTTELTLPGEISLGYLRADLDVPEYVQRIGLIADYALKRFLGPPLFLRDPRTEIPGERPGEIRKEPILIALCPLDAAGLTSPLQDYIEINTKNADVQNVGTVPHEIFHRVQYQYNNTGQTVGLYEVMREGGARMIEDSFCDPYNRYALQSQKIFKDPAQSLVHFDSRCGNPIGYSAALFWKYLAEQHSLNVSTGNEPDIGVDVYIKVLEATADQNGRPYEPAALRNAIRETTKPGSFDEFSYFDLQRVELNSNETSWGNYLLANYLHSLALPDSRFGYMEDKHSILWPVGGFDPITTLSELRVRTEDLLSEQNSAISQTVVGLPAYASRYYRITPSTSAPPRSLQISLNAFGGMSDPLIQILSFGSNGVLTDISKADRSSYTKTINMTDLSSVVVIVASRMNAGDYTIRFEEVPGGPDPMITRWNSATRTEYEVNPYDQPWTQSSPDLIIDNNDDYQPDAAVVPNANNSLKIRLHNRGNTQANGITVRLSYQADPGQLASNPWQPVLNASGEEQTVSGVALAAAGDNWFTVNWAPPGTSSSKLCIKAIIESPRDLNADNNTAIGCFIQAGSPPTSVARPYGSKISIDRQSFEPARSFPAVPNDRHVHLRQ